MTLTLVAGQNSPLQQRMLRFTASCDVAIDVSALIVRADLTVASSADFVFYNQASAGGVALRDACIEIDLDGVRPDASGVLCVVSTDPQAAGSPPPTRLSGRLADAAGHAVVDFAVPLAANETAVICFELYRRAAAWKVRAVGQGYAGGLAQLLVVHGVEVDDAPEPQAAPEAQAAPAAAAPPTTAAVLPIPPVDPHDPVGRIRMIFEDAARTTATYVSARDYAVARLDDELSAAVADPATRNGPAATKARADAQRRHDELVATAETRYQADAGHLIHELRAIDPELPRSLSSWASSSWAPIGGNTLPCNGIRVGEVTAPNRPDLRVPFCLSTPLYRPIWIDTTSSKAAAPVVVAIVMRLLAATPSPTPILDVVDLTTSLSALTGPLQPLMRDPVVTSHQDLAAKLTGLVSAVDLAELSAQSGFGDVDVPARVLVLSDFGPGLGHDDLQRVAILATRGVNARLSVVIVGDDESRSEESLMRELSEHCIHVPAAAAGDALIIDQWTRNEWHFTPDAVPQDADRVQRFMASFLPR